MHAAPSRVATAALFSSLGLILLVPTWGCRGSQSPQADAAKAPGKAGAAAAPAIPPQPTAPEPEEVVAKVNGVPIRARKLYEVAAINSTMLQSQGKPAPEDVELRRVTLQVLINEELLVQEARRLKLEPTATQLDEAVQKGKAQVGSEADYRKYLQQAGITEEQVRERARRAILMETLRGKIAGAPSNESEARAFYEANKGEPGFATEEQVHAAVIVVKSDSKDSAPKRAEARKRIEDAHRRALAGEDFAKLAKEYSQIPNAAKGGDLGFFARNQMFPNMENAAFETAPGKVSAIFEIPTGFGFVKVIAKKPSAVVPFDEVKQRLLLAMNSAKESNAMQGLLDQLRGKAQVEILDPEMQPTPPPPSGQAAGAS